MVDRESRAAFPNEEDKHRFEAAVDIALHTPPMHREKKPGAAKKPPRPAKAHRGGKSGGK